MPRTAAILAIFLAVPTFAIPVADLSQLVSRTRSLKQQERQAPPERRAELRRQIGETVSRMEALGDAEPNSASAQVDVARALLQADEPSRALERGRLAAIMDPRSADARVVVAEAHHKLGRLDEAAAHARRALSLDPGHKGAQAVLALSTLKFSGNAAGAAIKRAAMTPPPSNADAGALPAAARSASSAGAVRAAAPVAAPGDVASRRVDREELDGWLSQAHEKRAAGEAVAARELVEKVLKVEPDNVEALITRSQDRLARGRADEALADARSASHLAPKQAAAKLALAMALEATDAPREETEAAYRAAAELDPKFEGHHLAALARGGAKKHEAAGGGRADDAFSGALPGWAKISWPWLTLFALILGGASYLFARRRLS